jgi:HEPN domain-containing protein
MPATLRTGLLASTQQAVEKAFKVAIVLAEAELPHAHDLDLLIEQAAARAPLPGELAGVDWLTPWAVAMRYDEPTTALDRAAAVAAAESACRWGAALLDESARDACNLRPQKDRRPTENRIAKPI